MDVLIVHHLEMMWNSGYQKMGGTSFHELAEKLHAHCHEVEYDYIILTRFEEHGLGDEHYEAGLEWLVDEVREYGYGWTYEMVEGWESNSEWSEGGSHSEIVWVPNWLRRYSSTQYNVNLCGAFDGECIEDMEIALRSCGIEFNRIEGLIV